MADCCSPLPSFFWSSPTWVWGDVDPSRWRLNRKFGQAILLVVVASAGSKARQGILALALEALVEEACRSIQQSLDWVHDALSSRSDENQARKRSTNANFWVRISSGGVGVFHVKGWGPTSSVCSSKPRETKCFGGISWDFAGICWGCPKSLSKKSLCSILFPWKRRGFDRRSTS